MKKILKFSKVKILLGALFSLWMIAGSARSETRITITKVDGSEQVLILHKDNKLWFNDHSLFLSTYSGKESSFLLSTVKRLTIEGNVNYDGLDELMKTKELINIYPNPVNDHFNLIFSGFDKANLRIYDTTGALQVQGEYKSGSIVDVSNLHAGIFVVVINNQSFKLVKQ